MNTSRTIYFSDIDGTPFDLNSKSAPWFIPTSGWDKITVYAPMPLSTGQTWGTAVVDIGYSRDGITALSFGSPVTIGAGGGATSPIDISPTTSTPWIVVRTTTIEGSASKSQVYAVLQKSTTI